MSVAVGLILGLSVVASFSTKIEIVAGAAVAACAAAWVADRGALRRVLRVGLVLGAIFAAGVATSAVAWTSGLERGLLIGGTVLFRLLVLVTVAAVVARSIDAEKILRATSRLGFKRLGLVLGLALNTLPHLGETASTVWAAHRVRCGGRWGAWRRLPSLFEVLLAHTGRVADQAAAAAALRGHAGLARSAVPLATDARTVIVTGPGGSGKTPLVTAAVEELAARGVPTAGFFQPAILEGDEKVGFRITDVATGETAALARRTAPGEGGYGTSYSFVDDGFELGRTALRDISTGTVLVLDELGPVELRGGGHWPAVEQALKTTGLGGLLVVVRRTLVPALVEALDASDVVVVDLEEAGPDGLTTILDIFVTDP